MHFYIYRFFPRFFFKLWLSLLLNMQNNERAESMKEQRAKKQRKTRNIAKKVAKKSALGPFLFPLYPQSLSIPHPWTSLIGIQTPPPTRLVSEFSSKILTMKSTYGLQLFLF